MDKNRSLTEEMRTYIEIYNAYWIKINALFLKHKEEIMDEKKNIDKLPFPELVEEMMYLDVPDKVRGKRPTSLSYPVMSQEEADAFVKAWIEATPKISIFDFNPTVPTFYGTGEEIEEDPTEAYWADKSISVVDKMRGYATQMNINNYKHSIMNEFKKAEETVGVAKVLVTFGEALLALKEGKMVTREGWNGKGLFVFRQVPSSVDQKFIANMTSLPQSVKDEFEKRKKELPQEQQVDFDIRYRSQLALVKPNNEINGWSPSTADALAEDWIIL